MLFQQLGEDFVLALEFLLQSVNFLLQTIRNAGAGLLAFKSGCSVLKKLSLPLVKQRWVDVVLVAQIGNAFAFNQMLPENGDLLLGSENNVGCCRSSRLVLPASTSLASAHDFPIPSEAGQSAICVP